VVTNPPILMEVVTNPPILVEKPRLPGPAERIAIRRRAGISQTDLARMLEVRVQTVSSWEHGRTTPLGRNLPLYARALDEMRAMDDRSAGSVPAGR
jgi:DNA-binding transcriptional regulator YiaG